MEYHERDAREDVVKQRNIVCSTSGVLMKAHLQNTYSLGAPFGALVSDESSMFEGGEEISKMMNLVSQGIVQSDAWKTFIGDVMQEGPSGSAQRACWASAAFLLYTPLCRCIFSLIFSM